MKQDVLNPTSWNMSQWWNALLGVVLTSFVLGMVSVVTFFFH